MLCCVVKSCRERGSLVVERTRHAEPKRVVETHSLTTSSQQGTSTSLPVDMRHNGMRWRGHLFGYQKDVEERMYIV